MKTIQDIFLIFVIFLKLFYIISEFALGIYKKRKSINPKTLEKLEYYNEQMYLISQKCILKIVLLQQMEVL